MQALGFIDLALDNVSLGVAGAVQQQTPRCSAMRRIRILGGLRRPDVRRHDKFQVGARLPLTEDEKQWKGRTQVGFDLLDDNLLNGSLSVDDFDEPAASW